MGLTCFYVLMQNVSRGGLFPCMHTDSIQKDESTQSESAEQLAGTYMKQVEDREDTMEALSAGCTLI